MDPEPLPPIDAEGGLYRERAIEPERTVVLGIDMQNGEVGPDLRERSRVAGTPENAKAAYFERVEQVLIPNQRRLLAAARGAGIEVMFTTIESLTADGRDRSLDHKISRIHCPRGSAAGRVLDEVAPEGDEIVIPKTSSGVFNSTNIDYVLRNLGVRHLVLFGVLTDQCVESAIRDAADLGYLVTLIEDCSASYTAQRHEAAVRSMDKAYCRVRSTEAMVREFAACARPDGSSPLPADQ